MSLKVVGLISGGKDSLYSLAHCIDNGHEIVALANLYPKPSTPSIEDGKQGATIEEEDLNSFMYQTVGHTIIPLYSQALGLPLYRRAICGTAIETGRYYDPGSAGMQFDETEDLTLLLKDVLSHHPQVNAVCSGAILSTYQRTRVESVAVRLGLTPLSYLWQYPALPPPIERGESLTGLLDDMEAADCDARIIKIASGGIKDSLLWSNVTNARTRSQIVSGLSPFFSQREFWLRGAVLGEGGEYETLALSGPPSIWKKKILVNEAGSRTGEGGTTSVLFSKARTDDHPIEISNPANKLRIPSLLDDQFAATQESIRRLKLRPKFGSVVGNKNSSNSAGHIPELSYRLSSTHLAINNLMSCNFPSAVASLEPATQLEAIIEQLPLLLADIVPDLTPASIVSSKLMLRSMSKFAIINPIYSRLWPPGLPNPPARVTIATLMPLNTQVALSLVLSLVPTSRRQGLHVQSRSYWAPANIGPYSQAINVPLLPASDEARNTDMHDVELPEVLHMAGQIPLRPASMELLEPQMAFSEHAVLSLQHLWRVGRERGVDLWTWGVAYLATGEVGDMIENATTAMKVWQLAHESHKQEDVVTEEDDETLEADDHFDIWDLQNNRYCNGGGFAFSQGHLATTVGEHLHTLPNKALFKEMGKWEHVSTPSFVAAEVTALPRHALIEWWSMGLAGLATNQVSEARSKQRARVSYFATSKLPWGEISGFVVRLRNQSENRQPEQSPEDGTSEGTETSDEEKRMTTVVFATVLVTLEPPDMTETVGVPRSSKELLELIEISKSVSSGRSSVVHHEVVHATAFLNHSGLDSSAQKPPQYLTSPLFAEAATIPCHHVWASSATATEQRDSNSGGKTGFEEEEVREVGAALLLRIDLKS